jgi:hypothetical protein
MIGVCMGFDEPIDLQPVATDIGNDQICLFVADAASGVVDIHVLVHGSLHKKRQVSVSGKTESPALSAMNGGHANRKVRESGGYTRLIGKETVVNHHRDMPQLGYRNIGRRPLTFHGGGTNCQIIGPL